MPETTAAEMRHACARSIDADRELADIHRLLSAAWHQRSVRLRRPTAGSPGTMSLRLGEWIRRLCFFRFGVAFEDDISLLVFKSIWRRPRDLTLRLEWHVKHLNPEWQVFVHFMNEKGEIVFQGDHPFGRRLQDSLGFIYYDWRVLVAADVPTGPYAIRMGVWWARRPRHLEGFGFPGGRPERTGW